MPDEVLVALKSPMKKSIHLPSSSIFLLMDFIVSSFNSHATKSNPVLVNSGSKIYGLSMYIFYQELFDISIY